VSPPRVHAGCVGCGQTFEVVQEADRLCPRCRASSGLGPEEAEAWRRFLAGVDAGLCSPAREEPVGDSAYLRGFRCGLRRRPDPMLYGTGNLLVSERSQETT
jgi:hypothetical protein